MDMAQEEQPAGAGDAFAAVDETDYTYRPQLAMALALMTVIPLLTMAYFLTAYVTPRIVTRENVVLVVSLNVVLALGGFALLAREIQSRTRALKHACDRLRESEARFREIFDSARDGILVADTGNLRLRTANAAMCDMTGYDVHELGAMSLRDIHSEEALARVEGAFLADPETARLVVDVPVKRKDGSIFLADVNAGRMTIKGRQYLLAVFRDVTQRKDMEQQLADTNMRLQSALEELKGRERQIIQHERLAALGRMASGIAHDFNNVLMPVVGLSGFAREHPEVLDDKKETARILSQIEEAGRDAKQIVQRLRLINKARDDEELTAIDLNAVIESALELTRPKWGEEMAAGGGHVDIKTELGAVPPVQGNESEIREVLINLIMNSVDAMPDGGQLAVVSRAEASCVVLEVRDNGVGMDEHDLRECIEPFFTTKGVAGTGLGLSMVHGIVERHSGATEIESQPGRGTTVRIKLPVSQAAGGVPAKKEAAPERRPIRPLRVLVVDDERRSRVLLTRFLKADNHAVAVASSGTEAKERLAGTTYDLVITDRAMPDISGDEVARAARASDPDTPVILLTGFGEIMKDRGEKPEGVSIVMSKPLTHDDLRNVVAKVVA